MALRATANARSRMRRAGLLGEARKAELSNSPSEARQRLRNAIWHCARRRTPGAGCGGRGCLARPGRPSLATARAKRGSACAMRYGIARDGERPEQDAEGGVAWRGPEGRA